MAPERPPEVVLVRHGETEWSIAGRHTGRTDVPLTDAGRSGAGAMSPCLHSWAFTLVLSSPLSRASETCSLAGFGDRAELRDDLREWDYGAYEGRTTAEIRTERPNWSLWVNGAPDGESAAEVGERADRVISEAREAQGDVALFAHGHVLRVLAARWVGLPPDRGANLALATTRFSVLGYERETPVIGRWNQVCDTSRRLPQELVRWPFPPGMGPRIRPPRSPGPQ